MLLYLVRHAIAGDPDPERWPDDSQRPLTERGKKRFRRAARGLHQIAPRVAVVLSSPYTRAQQTAKILTDEAGWPAATVLDQVAVDAQTLLDALRQHSGVDSLAAVGHEPTMREVASMLLTGDSDRAALEFKKGTVACLEIQSDLQPGTAHLRWLASPKLLRLMGSDC